MRNSFWLAGMPFVGFAFGVGEDVDFVHEQPRCVVDRGSNSQNRLCVIVPDIFAKAMRYGVRNLGDHTCSLWRQFDYLLGASAKWEGKPRLEQNERCYRERRKFQTRQYSKGAEAGLPRKAKKCDWAIRAMGPKARRLATHPRRERAFSGLSDGSQVGRVDSSKWLRMAEGDRNGDVRYSDARSIEFIQKARIGNAPDAAIGFRRCSR